jgi:hypothetical protein
MAGIWFVWVLVIMGLSAYVAGIMGFTWFYMVKGERPFDAFGHALQTVRF